MGILLWDERHEFVYLSRARTRARRICAASSGIPGPSRCRACAATLPCPPPPSPRVLHIAQGYGCACWRGAHHVEMTPRGGDTGLVLHGGQKRLHAPSSAVSAVSCHGVSPGRELKPISQQLQAAAARDRDNSSLVA